MYKNVIARIWETLSWVSFFRWKTDLASKGNSATGTRQTQNVAIQIQEHYTTAYFIHMEKRRININVYTTVNVLVQLDTKAYSEHSS